MQGRRLSLIAPLAALAAVFPSNAGAHVTLGETSVSAGSQYLAVLTVLHGCGEAATSALRIGLDERLTEVEAMPKAGWNLEVVYAQGTDGPIQEIRWWGGEIPAHQRDSFTLSVRMPEAPPGTPIYFPVVQECGSQVLRWIEIPLADERPETLSEPAPFIVLTE